jgi:TRAP-type C4-dicarboxylate transport system permease small subunit
MFSAIHHKLVAALRILLIILMAAMAVDVLWQVVTRFILNAPSVWTEELARFILIWLGSLGAAYGVAEGFHLEMDYFLKQAKDDRRRLLERIILAILLLIGLGVFFFGGGRLVLLANELGQTSPALGLPMSLIYLALPLSGLLMAYFALHRMRHPLPPQTTDEPID